MTDTAIRLLRDGRGEGQPAPVVALRCTNGALGGHALFRRLLVRLLEAVGGGRAQARCLCVVAADQHPEDFILHSKTGLANLHRDGQSDDTLLHVVDCFSDPLGWNSEAQHQNPTHSPSHSLSHSLAPSLAHSLASSTSKSEAQSQSPTRAFSTLNLDVERPNPTNVSSLSNLETQHHNPTHAFSMSNLEAQHQGPGRTQAQGPGIQMTSSPVTPLTTLFCNILRHSELTRGNNIPGEMSKASSTEPAAAPPSTILVFDSLTPFFRHHHHAPNDVFSFLEALRWTDSISGVLVATNENTLSQHILSSLDHFSQAVLRMHPFPTPTGVVTPTGAPLAYQRGDMIPSSSRGFIELKQKRRTGRVLHMSEEFELDHLGDIVIQTVKLGNVRKPEDEPPLGDKKQVHPLGAPQIHPSMPGRGDGVQATRLQTEAKSRETSMSENGSKGKAVLLGKSLGPSTGQKEQVSFRMELSEEEKRAREAVVLPYEHRGGGKDVAIYDGRAGRSMVSGRIKGQVSGSTPKRVEAEVALGVIHYSRDSDEEDEAPDSDEDPDDDLDI